MVKVDKMEGDDWQLEAVHEQFEVFNSVTKPYDIISSTNLSEIINTTGTVVKNHLRTNNDQTETLRNISCEIIKAVPEKQKHIKLSYVIIVTNEEVRNNLSKFPVFVLLVGEKRKFIDMFSSVYNSWDDYISSNKLPACKLCFPVGGCYSVGGKLMIDFALSPAASNKIKRWIFIGGAVVTVGILALSWFFKVPPKFNTYFQQVVSIASKFFPGIGGIINQVGNLSRLIQNVRFGETSMIEFTLASAKILLKFYNEFNSEILVVFKEVKKALYSLYIFLRRKLGGYFGSTSDSQHEWLAIVNQCDGELRKAEAEAECQLSTVKREDKNKVEESRSDEENCNGTFQLKTAYNKNKTYNEQVFENCQDECSFQSEMMKKSKNDMMYPDSQPIGQTTEDILMLSICVANALKKGKAKVEHDIKQLFESITSIVLEEYKHKIDNYQKMVNAARAGAGHDIDFDAFNKSLGIEGDPKDFYMKETMQSISESRLLYNLNEKINEVQKQRKVVLIQMWKKSGDEAAGAYKCVGIRGAGKFSCESLISVLKEKFEGLDEKKLVVNETDSHMFIRCKELSVVVLQEVNEENTSEGVLYIERDSRY